MKSGLSALFGMAVGAVAGGVAAETKSSKKIEEMKDVHDKVHELYMAFDQWLRIRQAGKTLAEFFKRYDYQNVAVYGMRELGMRLCDELKGSGIDVCYAIDRNADRMNADIRVVKPEETLEPVDVIVVTAITFFAEIEAELAEKTDCPVISLKDVMDDVQAEEGAV